MSPPARFSQADGIIAWLEKGPQLVDGAARRCCRPGGGWSGEDALGSYAVMGRCDYVVVLDVADVATCIRVLSEEASGGNVRYETMLAIATGEFANLMV